MKTSSIDVNIWLQIESKPVRKWREKVVVIRLDFKKDKIPLKSVLAITLNFSLSFFLSNFLSTCRCLMIKEKSASNLIGLNFYRKTENSSPNSKQRQWCVIRYWSRLSKKLLYGLYKQKTMRRGLLGVKRKSRKENINKKCENRFYVSSSSSPCAHFRRSSFFFSHMRAAAAAVSRIWV